VLVLTRRAGESIVIGDDVRVVVLDVRGETVRLGIDAPRSIQVHRAEVYAEVQAANAAALAKSGDDLGSLTGQLAALARPGARRPSPGPARDALQDAKPGAGRRMVRMSEGSGRRDTGLDQVQDQIDEAKDAAAAAEEDLLPRGASPADSTSAEGGTFEPSGDETHAGENPEEGPERTAPGEPTKS
jgi:carbon storage regulator